MSESSGQQRLRFRVRSGSIEVELDGEFQYVREKFEELMRTTSSLLQAPTATEAAPPTIELRPLGVELEGFIETTPEGRPHFTFPFSAVTAKEAIGLMLFWAHPTPLKDRELSEMLSSAWKTTRASLVRARASELRKAGRLVGERAKYSLSGAGVEWMRDEVLPKLRGG